MRKCLDHEPLLQLNVGNKDLTLNTRKMRVAERVTTPYYTFSNLVNKREKIRRFEALLNTPLCFKSCYSHFHYEIFMLDAWQRFGKDMSNLLICSTVLQCNYFFNNQILNEMIPNVDMLCSTMKGWIFFVIEMAALLSQKITITPFFSWRKSANNLLNQTV